MALRFQVAQSWAEIAGWKDAPAPALNFGDESTVLSLGLRSLPRLPVGPGIAETQDAREQISRVICALMGRPWLDPRRAPNAYNPDADHLAEVAASLPEFAEAYGSGGWGSSPINNAARLIEDAFRARRTSQALLTSALQRMRDE